MPDPTGVSRIPRVAAVLSGLGFVWASAATLYILLASGHEGTLAPHAAMAGDAVVGQMRAPLRSANGAWVAGLLGMVTLVAGLPVGVALAHPRTLRRVASMAGLLLLGFSLLSGFTVGFVYLPGALVLLAASAAQDVGAVGEAGPVRPRHAHHPPVG